MTSIALVQDTGASATDGITRLPWVSGTATPNSLVTLMEGTTIIGGATVDAAGNWIAQTNLADGLHTITAIDAAFGGSASLTFMVDNSTAAPTIALANDTGTSSTDHVTSNPTLTGTAEAGATVAISAAQ